MKSYALFLLLVSVILNLPVLSQTIWLDQLDLSAMECGWGTSKANTSVEGNPLTIAGQKFDRGVGTHAVSTFLLNLDGKGKRFSASVGVDAETGQKKASVVFYLLADEKVVWESSVMHIDDPAKKIDIDLSHVKLLGLLVTGTDDGIDYDHADWCDAKLELTDPRSFSDLVVKMVAAEPYILTPKPSETPRINGAKVFGARPGNPFLYTIAAAGKRPMTFEARGLPDGLTIDPTTGRISGVIDKQGEYTSTLIAKNELGTAERDLRIKVGERICLTPPMGWNSWNCWGGSVSAEKVLSSARAMSEKGLINHGWTYINIDDGWQGVRGGAFNSIQGNRKFPDMVVLAREIHNLGLKIGIYSTPWRGSYEGHIGGSCDNQDGTYDWIKAGEANEDQRQKDQEKGRQPHWRFGKYSFADVDARQWAGWGIDYLKYDWNPIDVLHVKEMADALRKSGRDILLSLSNSATFESAKDYAVLANCWRTTGDIQDIWNSMSGNGFSQERWIPFAGPGHWNDPDMLVVGLVGWGPYLHPTRLTADEQYTHISLWSLLSAPLLLGCDLSRLDDFTVNLLANDEVIEIDQDPLGKQATRIYNQDGEQIWVKELEDGSKAIGLFYVDERELTSPSDYFHWEQKNKTTITLKASDIGLNGKFKVRDVWRQKDLGVFEKRFEAEVPYHGVVLVRIVGEQ
ncbi:MAG: NPCBM/NEW2 domain-containing protein [Ignavibacteria bacterium]|nr:NPCBM/NEW2 domain-containing protein [Ignavibacteria bacterium]